MQKLLNKNFSIYNKMLSAKKYYFKCKNTVYNIYVGV
jgi:hypothetical protein